ncbi:hypothetical protein ACFU5N_10795 [Streptomyces albidoflavus]
MTTLSGITAAGTGTASAAATAVIPKVTFSKGKDGHFGKGSVTTKGHSAPYRAKKGGNLPEGKKYTFWVCIADGVKWQQCSPVYDVRA